MKIANRLFVTAIVSIVCFSYTHSQGQANVLCLGEDTTVCAGQPVVITNCPPSGGSSSGNTLNLPNPTTVSLFDDSWSAAIPMGFTFNFYGNNYTSCLIGSNGLVSFNLASAGGYCPWSLNGTALPTTTVAGGLNAAMGCYQDLNPSNFNSGPVQYQTIGTAPNRIFVVLYKGVTGFSCTSSCNYSAFLFFEGTNNIEYHIGTKVVCAWNSNRAIQGTMNAAGTLAHITPGRNNSVWTATSDGKLFTPTTPAITTAYAISTIPYVAVTSGGTSTPVIWQNTLNQTFPYNGTTNSLTVTTPPPGTTGYYLVGTACGASIGAVSDTTWITRVNATVTASSISDTCSASLGTLTATPGAGAAPYVYSWSGLTATTATVNNVLTGSYLVTMTDNAGCNATATVLVSNVSVVSSGSMTVVSCPGGADGTATATMNPSGSVTTYLWDDAMAQTTQTATGLTAGTYTCVITDGSCVDIVTVVVTEIPAMQATVINLQDVNCHASNTGVISLNVINGTAPYNYVWTGSISTASSATDLYVGPQTVTITDFNSCVITVDTILSEPPALIIDSISLDSMICSESSIIIGAVGAGGSTPYTYTWYENGVQFSNNQYVSVDPVNSGTTYTVVLGEICGSPTDTDSLLITFPQDIIPSSNPIPFQACAPDTFTFVNTSVNGADIMSTVYDFSNGVTQIVSGMDTVLQDFQIAGMYDLTMTVTSNYGCIYTGTFPGIVSALQRPTAKFSMTTNPTTIFETEIGMIDQSIGAAQWYWVAPETLEGTSTEQNPRFNFPQKEGNYAIFLMVTSPQGCTDTTRNFIEVQNDFVLYAANTFTPDGDQFNQNWRVVTDGLDPSDFELEVFNRWGQVIWLSKDPLAEWDGTYAGKIVPDGIYNWKLRTKKTGTDEPRIFTGSVMIMR
ncbi:MAG: gliding motility-associated C-terminal domain-containing protein [Crocinitomicaceae bacterium]|nr:gliding motility-associated C-terminal domain-containing protein [Crocinitomicaceae bacterium]